MSNRVCAIATCRNNGYKLRKFEKSFCDTHQCLKKQCSCPKPFKLFPFPTELKDPEGRLKWAQLVRRKNGNKIWIPKEDARLCSEHFVDGKPSEQNPYPSINLGYEPLKQVKARAPPKARPFVYQPTPSKKVRLQSSEVQGACGVLDASSNEAVTNSDSDPNASQTDHTPESVAHIESDHNYGVSRCQGCVEKTCTIHNLRQKVRALETENCKLKGMLEKKSKRPFNTDNVLKSDGKTKFYTGFPSVASFLTVFTYIINTFQNIKYWKGPSRVCNILKHKRNTSVKFVRILTKKEEMIMTMMKIRLGLLNEDLADRFGVSTTHVSHVITTWIRLLRNVLGSLVFNPAKEVVKANLPPSFKTGKFSNVRHIIDCTEVFIEKPSSFQVQSATWSDYKHHHTVKALVSITPSGMINFISKGWGGRASDKHVTLHSGFLDMLEAYDTIMADKGFPIREDLALRHCELLIPPGRRGVAQMTRSDVLLTKRIANRRIHVEQAIRRLKWFRILKYELPISLLCHIDDILCLVAGICNMYPPIPRYK